MALYVLCVDVYILDVGCYLVVVVSDSLWPHGLYSPVFSAHGVFQGKNRVGCCFSDLPDPGIKLTSPVLQASFSTESIEEAPLIRCSLDKIPRSRAARSKVKYIF